MNQFTLCSNGFRKLRWAALSAACLLTFAVQKGRAEINVSNADLSNTTINFENGGVSTGTTINFTLAFSGSGATSSNIEIVIFRKRNVSDTPTADNIVEDVTQQGASAGTYHLFWPALWALGDDLGRQNGNFQVIVTALNGGSSGASQFVVGSLLTINSVDIHNVTATPSFDANGDPAFPYTINYALAKPAQVTVTVKNPGGTVVRTLLSNIAQAAEDVKPLNTLKWNGLDESGHPVPLGVYTFTLDAHDASTPDFAYTRTRTAAVTSLASLESDPQQTFESNAYIYPNPVRNGELHFHATAVRESATIKLQIYTIAGDLVREVTFPGLTTGSPVDQSLGAVNQAGKTLGRGLYYCVIQEKDAQGTLQTVKKIAVIP